MNNIQKMILSVRSTQSFPDYSFLSTVNNFSSDKWQSLFLASTLRVPFLLYTRFRKAIEWEVSSFTQELPTENEMTGPKSVVLWIMMETIMRSPKTIKPSPRRTHSSFKNSKK